MKRLLALALALGMMLTVMSVGVFAEAPTLQEQITAATGDTLTLPAGTYKGNITVNKPLTIVGAGEGQTIIEFGSPNLGEPYYPIINATKALTLKNLTVKGPTNTHYGIGGILASDGIVLENVTVQDIRCTADGGFVCGCQYGRALIVTGGDVIVSNCTFTAFQKCAMDIKTTGTINLVGNTIVGVGDQKIIGQNGIVIRDQGKGSVINNRVSNLMYSAENEYKACSVAYYLSSAGDENDISAFSELLFRGNTASNVDNVAFPATLDIGKASESSEPTEAEKAQQAAVSETTTAVSEAVSVLAAAATGDADAVKELAKTAETVTTAAGETLTAPVISIDSTVMPTIPWNLGDAMSGQSLLLKVKTADGYVYINTALIPKCGANRIFWPMSYLIQMFGITK